MVSADDRDFSGYRIIRPLELSDRASIWEAEPADGGERVAIETLAGAAAEDPDVREWFSEAWEAVEGIGHPNLVEVVEVGADDGVPFAVRRPGVGTTLARRLASRGPLDPEEAAALLAQVADGLDAAHDAGAVHGAIGPAAVVLTESGAALSAHLSGFGRAEGDRREDLRDLGATLAATLASSGAGEAGEALREVARAAAEDAYAGARELRRAILRAAGTELDEAAPRSAIAAAESPGGAEAREGDAGGPGRGRRRRALAIVAAVAIVAALVIVRGAGDDGGGSATTSSVGATPSTGDATTPADGEPPGGAQPPPGPIRVGGFPVGVAARDTTVYVVTRDSGTLSGYDQSLGDRRVGPVELGAGGEDLTVVDDVAWVTLPGDDAVARVDLSATVPTAERLGVGSDPSALIAAAGSIWVTDSGSGELSRVPQEGGEAAAASTGSGGSQLTVPLAGSKPQGIAFGLGYLWVTDAGGTVTRVDPANPADQRSFEVGASPQGVLVVDGTVYVANSGDGTVSELDPRSGQVTDVEVGGSPGELAADPEHLWVVNGEGFVTSIGLTDGAMSQIDLNGAGGTPQSIAVGEQVWATTGAGDSLIAVAPGR